MKSEYSVAELVPHSGKMSLLDNIVEYRDGWLRAEVSITADSMFADEHGVPAWIGIEYMAQTVAAFVGADARQKGEPVKIGFLLGTRRFNTNITYFVLGQKIMIRIKRLLQESELGQFQCWILDEAGEELAMGKISAYMPDDCHAFLESQGL